VVRAPVQVLPDPIERRRSPGRDDRRDQPVTPPVREVGAAVAEPFQVAGVVRQPQVSLAVRAPGSQSLRRVPGERDRLLGHEQRRGAEYRPGERRVLGGSEIRMGSERLVARQPQHLRPEGREHDRRQLAVRSVLRRVVEFVEELLHLLQRPLVGVPERGDQRSVADPKPEYEPAGELPRQVFHLGTHPRGLPCPDVGDPGGDDQVLAAGEQRPKPCERVRRGVAAANPRGREPGPLDRSRGRRGVDSGPFRRRHPDPHAPQP
jgi:hypothetical protein